jgi:hypothetical protein
MCSALMAVLCSFAIGAPSLSAQVGADTLGADTAVYQAIVRFWHAHSGPGPRPMLVALATAPGWASPAGRASLASLLRADSMRTGIRAEFLRRNATPANLRPDWGTPDIVHWLDHAALPSDASDSAYAAGWSRIQEQYPDAGEIIQWSRAAFTAAGDSAIVILEAIEPPPRGRAGCRTDAQTYWLTKVDGKWQVAVIGYVSHYARTAWWGEAEPEP